MKFVIAPDSFKESVDAFQACDAMKEGISKVFNDCEYEVIPMADGGEGTSKVITFAKGGQFVTVEVTGPLGNKVEASYGYIKKEKTAVIEVAAGCGLDLVPMDKRNPLETTTYGVGEIINDALNRGAKHLIIGLGGSSTNDGGIGMFTALGGKILDSNNNQVELGGKGLEQVNYIDLTLVKEKLQDVTIEVACDVENPLVGETGATYTFGRQKGADEEKLKILEEGMINYANVIKNELGIDVANAKKAGAAGGLGGAFMMLNCKMVRGIDLVINHTNFEKRIKNADFVFTGEGSIDAQTKYGKTISGIANVATKQNAKVIVMAGRVGNDIDELYEIGIDSIFGIVDSAKSIEKALEDGYKSIVKTSENIARLIKCCK